LTKRTTTTTKKKKWRRGREGGLEGEREGGKGWRRSEWVAAAVPVDEVAAASAVVA